MQPMQQMSWITVAVTAILVGGALGAWALGAHELAQGLAMLVGIFIPGQTLLAKVRSSMRPPPMFPETAEQDLEDTTPQKRRP